MKLTLIVARRIATTPKTAGAGVMLEASFPMFTRPRATSNERIAPSCFFGCLDLSVMVETQGSCEVAVLYKRLRGRSRTPIASTLALDPFDDEKVETTEDVPDRLIAR